MLSQFTPNKVISVEIVAREAVEATARRMQPNTVFSTNVAVIPTDDVLKQ